MKAILDEGVPRDLLKALRAAGCGVAAFPNEWKGTKNGRLLSLPVEAGYQCLVTADRNLKHQQNLRQFAVGVVELPTQNLAELDKLAIAIAKAVLGCVPGDVMPVRREL